MSINPMNRTLKVYYEVGIEVNIARGEFPHKDALAEARDLGYLSILVGPDKTLTHIPWNRVVKIET